MHFAAQGVIAGAYDVVIACGVESMSRVPMWSNVPAGADPFGPGVAARYPDGLVPQGISAELIAAKWSIGREQMDEFAARRTSARPPRTRHGLFAAEIAPVERSGPGHDATSPSGRAPRRRSSPGSHPPSPTPPTPSASRRSTGR